MTNARITIEVACGVQQGESVLILSESKSKAPYQDKLAPISEALALACTQCGAYPVIMDIGQFVHSKAFPGNDTPEPIRAAIRAADVVLNAVDYVHFTRLLGEGNNEAAAWESDKYITGAQRLYALQSHGMEQWEITAEEVANINRRTDWLLKQLSSSRSLHIRSQRGTDFRVGLTGATANPFRILVPLYGEVALVPRFGTENGKLVIDGPTQRGIRRHTELDRPPLEVDVTNGQVVDFRGDPEQVDRLREFIHGSDPIADHVDEVGIPTTRIKANDAYWWEDGTHHSHRVHVALGNNPYRDQRVHGVAHMDGEIISPTVTLDDTVIIRDGAFLDNLID